MFLYMKMNISQSMEAKVEQTFERLYKRKLWKIGLSHEVLRLLLCVEYFKARNEAQEVTN